VSVYPCPKNGCDSSDPDWCSECGANMHPTPVGEAVEAASPLAPTLCPDCGTPRDNADEWCGVCRYNFVTGRSYGAGVAAPPPLPPMPPPPAPPAPSAPPPAAPASAQKPALDVDKALAVGAPKGAWRIVIDFDPSIDRSLDPSCVAPRPRMAFPLDLPEMRIGRRGAKDHPELPIDDEGVSSRHARISFTTEGWPVLLDLGSTNGTFVNGAPLVAGVPVALASGDVIIMGRWTRITVKSDAQS
jgi:hypothetical protein